MEVPAAMTQGTHDTSPPPGPPHDTRTETHSEPAPGAGGADGGAAHDTAGHADAGHAEHGHGGDTLGPIDVWAWGAGALGILIAAAMVACFAIATSPVPVA